MHDADCLSPESAAKNQDCRKEAEMNKQRLTLLYARLSVDDERDGDSLSIQNQKMLLETYAERNGMKPYLFFSDDGYSGTSWDRPGWQKIIGEIETGNVQSLVVKNLDRIGRDYLRVGLLMEMLTERHIRLIAINDGIDTANGEDDFAPLRALFAEWYARDTSNKIRAIFKAKEQEGKHVSPAVPYGYLRDKNDKQKWVVDDDAAATVRRIFNMIIDGYGVAQIARILTDEKVLNPSAHNEAVGGEMHHIYTDPYQWRSTVVATILCRREYLGHTVNHKSYKESYKTKQRKFTSVDEQLVFENTHPAIVDEEVWHNAQRLRNTIRRAPKCDMPQSRLTGLLYCKDCGAKMTYRASAPGHGAHNEFVCSRYRKRGTVYTNVDGYCTSHFTSVPIIEAAILFTIKTVAKYVLKDEAGFIERVRESSIIRQRESAKDARKKIAKAEKRMGELEAIVKKLLEANATGRIPDSHFDKMFAEYAVEQETLNGKIAEWKKQVADYENDGTRADKFIELVKRYTQFDELTTQMLNAMGKIPDKHFERMMAEYDAEQTALETTMAELQNQIDAWHEDSLKTDMFIELAKRYTDFTELTTPMLNEFVERVVVHEGEGRGKNRHMRVDVDFTFIGNFEVDEGITAPADIEENERIQAEMTVKNKLSQELLRERYEQRKAEKREFTARKKAGLLTPEEVKADELRRERNREWQRQWREKKAAETAKLAAPSNHRRGKNELDGTIPLPAGM